MVGGDDSEVAFTDISPNVSYLNIKIDDNHVTINKWHEAILFSCKNFGIVICAPIKWQNKQEFSQYSNFIFDGFIKANISKNISIEFFNEYTLGFGIYLDPAVDENSKKTLTMKICLSTIENTNIIFNHLKKNKLIINDLSSIGNSKYIDLFYQILSCFVGIFHRFDANLELDRNDPNKETKQQRYEKNLKRINVLKQCIIDPKHQFHNTVGLKVKSILSTLLQVIQYSAKHCNCDHNEQKSKLINFWNDDLKNSFNKLSSVPNREEYKVGLLEIIGLCLDSYNWQ